MLQLIAHLIGDYLLQSGWMANNKTKRHFPALMHALVYFLPFYFLFHPSDAAAFVMVSTHFAIDRWRLARYVTFVKEFLAPPSCRPKWADHEATGYHKDLPPFLAVWLGIVADNALHLIINALALAYL